MWVLALNDMRDSKIEILRPVMRAQTREALLAVLERESVPAYATERGWHKSFRQGGPLEWYNPPFPHDECIRDVGTPDDWMADAARAYQHEVMDLPAVEEG